MLSSSVAFSARAVGVATFAGKGDLGSGITVEGLLQVAHVVAVVHLHVAGHPHVAATFHEEPTAPTHLVECLADGGKVDGGVVAQPHTVGIGGVDGADVFGTEATEVLAEVPTVLHDGLELVEDGDAAAVDFLQQLQVALGVEGGVDAHALATGLGGLADGVQPSHHLGTLRLVGGPFVAATAQGEEGDRGATHLVHRVEAVGDEFEIGVFLRQVLRIETAHGDGADLDAQTVGGALKDGGFGRVAQLVLKSLALTE